MYYPKSQIKPNLYTNGGEYIVSSTKEGYIGYYYETSTGQKYTGKFPGDGQNLLLIQAIFVTSKSETSNYPSPPTMIELFDPSQDKILPSRTIPSSTPTLPTEQDKQKGQFIRYFCKKTNENIYLEIDQDTYKQLISQDPKIAWDLYNPTQIIWIIKGDKTQTYTSNKGSVTVIEQQKSWYGFTQWFKDKFLQYYLES
jgi:hypothetical protein